MLCRRVGGGLAGLAQLAESTRCRCRARRWAGKRADSHAPPFVDASAASLVPFVQDSVEPGRVIHTDGWLGYLPLESRGYEHEVTVLKGKKKPPSELMPRVHLA